MPSTQQRLFIPTLSHQIKKGLLLILEQHGNLEDDGYESLAAKANWSPHLKPSAFVLCRCDWYSPAEHNPMLEFGKMTFLAVPMDVSTLKYVWN